MADGVAAIRQLLASDATLTALVPSTRIQAGFLPRGTTLPAISITPVSGVDLSIHAPGSDRFTTDRVQITVLAANYPGLQQVLSAAKSAVDAKYPTVTGLENVVVRTDGQGPYFMNEDASIHLQTQDVKVSFTQAA